VEAAKFVFLSTPSHLGWEDYGLGHSKRIVLAMHPGSPPLASVGSTEDSWSLIFQRFWESLGRPKIHTLIGDDSVRNQSELCADSFSDGKRVLFVGGAKVNELERAQVWLKQWQGLQRQLLLQSRPDLYDALLKPSDQEQWLLERGNTLELFDLNAPRFAKVWHERNRRKKMLVHVCCGPDAVGVIRQLKADYDLVAFWYDPNIQPRDEYDRRLEAFRLAAESEGVPAVIGEYDVDEFFSRIRGLEWTPEQGAKCTQCYDMRLERAALEATAQGCDAFTTTLAISPHKVQQKLEKLGIKHSNKTGIPYLARNFMKEDGFKTATEVSDELGLYRQDYCGCLYSMYEGGPRARATADQLGLTGPNEKGKS
jgi:predicted adenine nucleotide alpha hydrolase (AANH) superfamily ATPase